MASAPTAVIRNGPGWHDVFYLNTAGNVVQRVVSNGVPSPEYDLGGSMQPGSTVAAAWRPGFQRLDLFGRGVDGALMHKEFTWATGWGDWVALTPPGTLTSAPSAAAVDATRTEVFFRDNERLLNQVHVVDGQPVVHEVVALNGHRLTTGPTAVARVGGDISVLMGVESPSDGISDLDVFHWYGDRATWTVNEKPWGRITSSPAAYHSGVTMKVAARDVTGALAWTRHDIDDDVATGPIWRTAPAPSLAGSAPAVVTTPGARTFVYLRSHDNQLITRYLEFD